MIWNIPLEGLIHRLIARYQQCAPGCVCHPSDQLLVGPMEIGLILNLHVLFIVGDVADVGGRFPSILFLLLILYLILLGLVKLQIIEAAIL
jgi:hypothetical protein